MPNAPAFTLLKDEPCACAASSTSHSPFLRAKSCNSRIRFDTIPPMCTTMIPAVLGVRHCSTSSGLTAKDSGSMSTNTGRPPACTTAAAVAKNVFVGTSTSCPCTSRARRMISRELVPLLTAIA